VPALSKAEATPKTGDGDTENPARLVAATKNTIAEKNAKTRKRGRSPEGPFLFFFASHSTSLRTGFLRFLRPCSPVFLAFLASLRET
jgi:hypothetical protein